jgi:glucosamine-6-phosphate deaminase
MRADLFDRVGLSRDVTWIPSSDVERSQVAAHCREYERAIADAGGLDLQILGVGRNGHIGFNEPGSPRDSRTREVELSATTRSDAVQAFGGIDHVPQRAITMGVATILDARRIRVVAFGAGKREIVHRMLSEPIGPALPATFLREHADLKLYLDADAASLRHGCRSVYDGTYHLLIYQDGRTELYDVSQDPLELVDLSATNDAEVERLRPLLLPY